MVKLYVQFCFFLLKNILITKFQSGFRPSDTVNQLISILIDFRKAIEDGKEIRMIFFDISEAFDHVWHKGILYKLKSIGIDDAVLKWFESYLSNRRQKWL